jgi:mycothiol synthase
VLRCTEFQQLPLAKSAVGHLVELARTQAGTPGAWSLATATDWLERTYCAPGVATRLWEHPSSGIRALASVAGPDVRNSGTPVITVTAMLAPGSEDLWNDQRAWIEEVLHDSGSGGTTSVVQVVSEALTDSEQQRWTSAGYRLVFEELAMERSLNAEEAHILPRWPRRTRIVDWCPEAVAAAFAVYSAAFRERPGFPGWSQAEWTDRCTGDDDFLPEASLCAFVDDAPAGYVVCTSGWIDQVGVVSAHRRIGLATALVTEAILRMRPLGVTTVRLHVNVNNPAGLATWQALGWRAVGRRGRFERPFITSRR